MMIDSDEPDESGEPTPRQFTAANFAQLLKDMHFGEIPPILPPEWRLYYSIKCPSCGSEMYWISTEKETDMLYRHVWCDKLDCIQNKRLYTVLVTPQDCSVVGSEPR